MSIYIFSGIPILVFWISYLIRYGDAREYYLRAICAKYMTKCVYVNKIDMELITQVLTSTEKGDFIERRIATPAWFPIISLESCDGEQWIRTKRNFMTFWNVVSLKNIDLIVTSCCKKTEFLDSVQISKIAVFCFCNKIFNYNLSETELDILYKASLEWRKDIAMKGYGNMLLKMKAVNLHLRTLKTPIFTKLYL